MYLMYVFFSPFSKDYFSYSNTFTNCITDTETSLSLVRPRQNVSLCTQIFAKAVS